MTRPETGGVRICGNGGTTKQPDKVKSESNVITLAGIRMVSLAERKAMCPTWRPRFRVEECVVGFLAPFGPRAVFRSPPPRLNTSRLDEAVERTPVVRLWGVVRFLQLATLTGPRRPTRFEDRRGSDIREMSQNQRPFPTDSWRSDAL